MSHSLGTVLVDVSGIDAAAGVLDGDEPYLDLSGIENVVFHIFATKNGGATLNVAIEESINAIDWIASGIVFSQLGANGSQRVVSHGDDITTRYVRARRTSVGDGWDYKVLVNRNAVGL